MTNQQEAKQRWLDLARDYDRQADHTESTKPSPR